MSLLSAPLTTPNFTAQATATSKTVVVRLRGNADNEILVAFDRYMQGLHKQVCELRFEEVRVDASDLYFMNSSCMKVFVTWLNNARLLDPALQYRIVFLSSPNQPWQPRTFDALRHIARSIVTVRPAETSAKT